MKGKSRLKERFITEVIAANFVYEYLTDYEKFANKKCLDYFPNADEQMLNSALHIVLASRSLFAEIENFGICLKLLNKEKQNKNTRLNK
ncbi:MAG: hypothetical protein IJX03_00200 [Clostridia bacterium]|nr:hypothetical protein [Clostridia bacterium]